MSNPKSQEILNETINTSKSNKQINVEQASKVNLPEKNPCVNESTLVYNCLNEHSYEREKCEKHFENYRNCKKFWGAVKKERWLLGIKPYLPPVEERAKVKRDFSERHGYGYR